MSSENDIFTKLELQELEIKDLKSEIAGLRQMILVKNTENGKMKMSLRTTQKKLSSLQILTMSYSDQVKNILSPDQMDMITPSDTEPNVSRCDTSTDMSVSSPLFIPRQGQLSSFQFHPPNQSTGVAPPPPPQFSVPPLVPDHNDNLSVQSTAQTDKPPQSSAGANESSPILRKVFPARSASIAKSLSQTPYISNPTKVQLSAAQPQPDPTGKLSCPECGKKFTNLNLHLTLKHKKKPVPANLSNIKCHLCKRTVKKENEANHMKKVHNNESSASDPEYEVETVITSKQVQGKQVYQVRWRLGDTTWEPEENLTNCKEKIEEYWEQQKIASSNHPSTSLRSEAKKIKLKIRSLERNPRGGTVPSVKMMVKESTSVKRVRMKYAKTLNVKVEQLQLMLKDRKLKDGERVKGLEGEVLTATGLSWVL